MTKPYQSAALVDGFKMQYQVVRALFLRQILLNWGRNNLGFLWMFAEPLVLISVVVSFFSLYVGAGIEKAHFGISIVPFLLIGFSSAILWRHMSFRCAGAFSGNIPLLEHRFIRPLDLILAAALVEVLSVSVSFVSIYIVLWFFGLVSEPERVSLMILGWFLMMWFAISFGVFFGSLSGAFEPVNFVMRGVNILLYLVSGVIFCAAWLPPNYRELALYIPMLHGNEMIRHGYFGDRLLTFENPLYLITWNVVLTFMGLAISRASWLEDIRE